MATQPQTGVRHGVGFTRDSWKIACTTGGIGFQQRPAILRILTEHPASVGESYLEHLKFAFGFGSRMVIAGTACCIHGVLPFLFGITGSRTIRDLNAILVAKRSGPLTAAKASLTTEYEI